MSDKNLRQAMAYALDLETLSEQFYSGLRHRATSHIPPTFDKYFNDQLEGYPHDPDKANQLLDEAKRVMNGQKGKITAWIKMVIH